MKQVFLFFFCSTILLDAFAQITPKLILPTGHLGGITKLDGSPNDKLLLTEDLNSDIIIIDSDKLIELQRYHYGGEKIISSTFLNDSSVISICNDTLIYVWNFYSNEVDIYPVSVKLTKLYVKGHGFYCIDNKGIIYKFQLLSKQAHLEKLINHKAKEIYFKSENEFFLVNGKNLVSINLSVRNRVKKKFENSISALTWNQNGNILLGFDNGEIIEYDSTLTLNHNYNSASDRISVIGYIGDSAIISGSYDFSIVAQNKKGWINSILFDDWIVGLFPKQNQFIVGSWSGMIKVIKENLEVQKEFQTSLKKATYFRQRGNQLFLSYNDGSVGLFDVNSHDQKNQYYPSSLPILGIDIKYDSSEIIIWNSSEVIIFNIAEKIIKADYKINNVTSASFIPNTSKYIFCSDEFLYSINNNGTLDSIPLIDSWSVIETQNSLLISGLNRIIEIDAYDKRVLDFDEIGQIWLTQKNQDHSYLLVSARGLYHSDVNGKIYKITDFPMLVNDIEMINQERLLVNCENGQLLQVDVKSKKIKIIADTKQDFASWGLKVNSGKIIYPNSKSWDYKMDVDVLDLNGELLKKLENVGGEVICVSNSNKSIEFNQLDSNKVLFIVSDGSVKQWDINSDGKDPITQLGFNYYNILKSELKDFNINGSFLKSGLLKLPIPGVDTLTLMNLKNGDWLVHDSKFRFDGTPGAIEKLYFTCGVEVIELNQVKDSLYVPNLVQRYLNGENLDHIPQINNLQICGFTPFIEPIDSLSFRIIPRMGGLGNVDVYIDGILRKTFNPENLKFENGIYLLTMSESEINPFRTSGRPVKIKVIAKTANNSVSSRGIVVEMDNSQEKLTLKPSIHAIMIGVDDYKDESLGLKYAAKDANDLQIALELAAKNYFNVDDTSRVFFYNLTINDKGKNGNDFIKGITPDRVNILRTILKIEETSKPEDIILLFFAGHGEIVDGNQLLLLTTESTRDNFQGVKMSELLTMMNKIPAGKRILILDACHSGAAINNLDLGFYSGKRDVSDAERETYRLKELDKLANKSGFAIITASGSDQKALELPQYEHGLLTYCLLNSIVQNKTVLGDDNQLVLEKWFIAAEEEMKKLNKDQNAEKMIPTSFNIGIINDEVKQMIKITETPMLEIGEVINRSQYLTDSYPLDNYLIREKFKTTFLSLKQITNKQILLIEGGGNAANKLIIKYNVSNEQIEIKCSVVYNESILFTLDKLVALNSLDKVINELVFEIYNRLENDF